MEGNDAHGAFIERLDRHRGILLRVAGAYCRDRANREDLLQEMVAQLWRSYPRFDGRAAFSTWMYRIALNVAISFQRAELRKSRRGDSRRLGDERRDKTFAHQGTPQAQRRYRMDWRT